MNKILLLIALFISFNVDAIAQKKRVLVLTDIEADPDDAQSLVRFLTYSNQWDIEGLIATTSIHQKDWAAVETLHDIVDAYDVIQPNLLQHEKGYPTAAFLKTKIKKGLEKYGMEGVGEGKDSEGSEWLIKVLSSADNRPLWVCVWGGSNCLAQALWKIKNTKSAAEADKLYQKLRVYTISDQDDSNPWIRKTFPSIFFITSPGFTYMNATWRGINAKQEGFNNEVISDAWLSEHIQQKHSVLGTKYPDVAYGMEGDTPTFLSLIENGLNEAEKPNYGGWGGRYELYIPEFVEPKPNAYVKVPQKEDPETRPIWTNAKDSVFSLLDKKGYTGNLETVLRWREDFQNDFAVRMDWTFKSYKEANHPPVPKLNHAETVTVKSGEKFFLDAKGTTDPDGDALSYVWFQYREAGTYAGNISFRPHASNMYRVPFTAPSVEKPETIHFILKVTDKGTPRLSRYKRVIVTVVPK
ncbi:MAG: DUF1593 domain-containing protein [Saprospiraceae bacterium]|nr:DUF1593 domain-containing protein [Saprospiraceae bacterium]